MGCYTGVTNFTFAVSNYIVMAPDFSALLAWLLMLFIEIISFSN